jgi:hypothetical protein
VGRESDKAVLVVKDRRSLVVALCRHSVTFADSKMRTQTLRGPGGGQQAAAAWPARVHGQAGGGGQQL